MSETASDMEIDYNSSDDNKIIVQPGKPTYFTCLQIKNLLKLELLDVSPQNCVLLASSALELDNIEENFRHFWLVDIMTIVVKNIQRTRMSDSQGAAVVGWVNHFISLAVDEKLSKAKLFETLYEYVKIGLTNADELTIPAIANIQECPNYNTRITKSYNKVTIVTTETTQYIFALITNTIHKIFWDDFKYTVIQMAFNTEQPDERPEMAEAKATQKINNLRRFCTTVKNEDGIIDNECNFKCCTIMDRYFFREINYNKPSSSTADQSWSI